MPVSKVNIHEFLSLEARVPILDVRSPGEFAHARIPGAFSFPIFSNDERKIIGTAYKQESREKAIKLGLEFFGRTMVRQVEEAEKIIAGIKGASKEVRVHCWRGGMRSAAIAWLLDLYGFKVYLLQGGYKAYRRLMLEQLARPCTFRIVGGYTGSNKTGMIHTLEKQGEAVIDLEGLAVHKGSSFGNLDRNDQPSQEQFENLLGSALLQYGPESTIWLEGESQRLGLINIPFGFYQQMRNSPLYFIDVPFEKRLAHILRDYGDFGKEKLINAIVRIKKKLGGLEAKNAVNALLEDDVAGCFTVLLRYYDKLYLKSTLNTKDGERPISYIRCDSTDENINTEKLIQHIHHGEH